VLVLGIFALGLILILLAAFPRTRKALSGHPRLAFTLILVYFALLFLHPYIFGLPGRIAEARFQRQIHSGMTRSEIVRLAEEYGGSGLLGMGLSGNAPYDWRSDGLLIVSFTDTSTFCVVGGKEYDFYFRPDWTLTEWKAHDWGNAC
jgi:hypothetical protein